MARTFIRQSTQIAASDEYNDRIDPASTWESATTIEENLNHLRSQIQNILNRDGDTMPSDNWYDDIFTPATFENGRQRGVDALNTDLHSLERKRVLTSFVSLPPNGDIAVPSGQNWVVLSVANGETPSVFGGCVAIGVTETTGSVAAAHGGTFGTQHSMTEVAGATAISPKNLCMIVTGSNRDPLLYENSVVYGLLQTEDGTDGHILDDSTKRAQISFVYVDPVAGNDLIAAPVSAIEGLEINYVSTVRKALADLNEQDFLRGAEIDVPSTSATTRQNAYSNQGANPVEVGTNSILDIGSNFYWEIRDDADASIFKIEEGSGNSDTTVTISSATDYLVVGAGDVDFASGAKFATGGTQIDIGVNAGIIETGAASDLTVLGGGELYLNDGNQAGSSWDQTGIKLSEDTAEWDAFETAFGGEVSLLKAVTQSRRRPKVYSVVTAETIDAEDDVSFTDGNIGTALPDMGAGTFGEDYDVYLNGQLLYPGATNDYYAGTSDTSLKFLFPLKEDDIICVVPYVRT